MPVVDAKEMFSAYTKSFTANGAVAVVNPRVGVARTQVTTPAGDEKTLLTPTPLLLFMELSSLATSYTTDSPFS